METSIAEEYELGQPSESGYLSITVILVFERFIYGQFTYPTVGLRCNNLNQRDVLTIQTLTVAPTHNFPLWSLPLRELVMLKGPRAGGVTSLD